MTSYDLILYLIELLLKEKSTKLDENEKKN